MRPNSDREGEETTRRRRTGIYILYLSILLLFSPLSASIPPVVRIELRLVGVVHVCFESGSAAEGGGGEAMGRCTFLVPRSNKLIGGRTRRTDSAAKRRTLFPVIDRGVSTCTRTRAFAAMSSPHVAAPADNGGFGGGFDIQQYLPALGFVMRLILIEGVVGVVLGAVGLSDYLACCPSAIFDSYGVQFYRILVSPLISEGLLSGLFALLTLYQLASRIEGK